MIFINPNIGKIALAREIHEKELTILLKKRVNNLNSNLPKKKFLQQEIIPILKIILIGNPNKIKKHLTLYHWRGSEKQQFNGYLIIQNGLFKRMKKDIPPMS